jgi:hypothetical protein
MFLNPLMLVAAGAAVLPVVIHLLSRSRYRSVDWGAMMFLDGADANRERRSRLRQWLLLAVRAALVALLAVALARPVVRGRFGAPAAAQKVTAVILLDCSPSMDTDENGHSRMALARAAARQVLALHRGDRVSVVLMGREQPDAEREPTADLWEVGRRIDAAEPGYRRANIADGLINAIDALERASPVEPTMPAPAPGAGPRTFANIYVITDRQATSWREVDDAFPARWKDRLSQAQVAARLLVLPVGGVGADNVAVEEVKLANGPLVAGQAAQLQVTLRNYGPVRWASLPLTVSVEKRVVAEQRVNLAPGSALTIPVTVKDGFAEPGSYVVTAEIGRQPIPPAQTAGAAPAPASAANANPPAAPPATRPSGFAADDHMDAVVDVAPPIKVLVVSGDEQRPDPAAASSSASASAGSIPSEFAGPRNEADYLRVALAPYHSAKRKTGDLSTVDVVAAEAWDGPTAQLGPRGESGQASREENLAYYQVVILANVERLTTAQARAVEQFVYDGGGLLIAPGILSRPEEYNDYLYRGGSGILPAALREPTADDGSAQTSLSGFDATHPVFSFLGGRPDAFLPAVIWRYFPVDRQPAVGRVLASYASGDPFLLEYDVKPDGQGRGRVLLMTTALDADWTTLPLTNFYLPFVQSAVRYLAAMPVRKSELKPGEPIEVQFDDPGTAGRKVWIATPDSGERPFDPAHAADSSYVRFTETDQPGKYHVRVADPGRPPYSLYFVVRRPPEESDPRPLGPERWQWLQRTLGVQRIDTAEAPLSASAVASAERRELWAWLLGGVFLLAIAELALARRWSREPADADGEDEFVGGVARHRPAPAVAMVE